MTHADAALARGPYDPAYLEARIESGEAYEFFYASVEDRIAQTRTPISDGAYDEPWIYRAKDVRNFWQRAHHNRPGGVRASSPTAWIPQSKPIWFVELGCPAVDKGANAPNLFTDAKSAESGLPPFSSGARDDLIQRRALEAYLRYWTPGSAHNPISTLTGAPMIEDAFLWCWDARPHPAFPARNDVWTDGEAWRRGHWMNGRAGLSGLGAVVSDLCARGGADDVDVSALAGAVSGYVVDSPSSVRAALEPLMAAYAFEAAERDGRIIFFHPGQTEVQALQSADFAGDASLFATRRDSADAPVEARVRFLDPSRDYLVAGVSARRLDRAQGGVETLDAPLVLEADAAETMARRLLTERRGEAKGLRIELGPAQLALEPGDCVALDQGADTYEVLRVEEAELRQITLRRTSPAAAPQVDIVNPKPPLPAMAPKPAFAVLDLPPLRGAETDERPLAAVFASPWTGSHTLLAGGDDEALTRRCEVTQPATMGELLWDLWPGPTDRWDDGNVVRVRLYRGALASVTPAALLNGANAFAIESNGEWEIVQARDAVLVAPNEYELSGFLRGQLGSAHAMRAPHPIGARIVKLDARLARLDMASVEWSDELTFVVPPAGAATTSPRAARANLVLPHAAARPWPPAHVRASRLPGGDVQITWVRRARTGDHWGAGDPPLGFPSESYQVVILDGTTIKRIVTVASPAYFYSTTDQTVDFGAPPGALTLRVAQMDAAGAVGLNTELTIPL